jgi:hypothetical protein
MLALLYVRGVVRFKAYSAVRPEEVWEVAPMAG